MGDEAGEAVQDLKGRRELKAIIRKLNFKKKRRVSHCSVQSEPRNPRSFWWRERERAMSWAKCLHLSMWGLRMGKAERWGRKRRSQRNILIFKLLKEVSGLEVLSHLPF